MIVEKTKFFEDDSADYLEKKVQRWRDENPGIKVLADGITGTKTRIFHYIRYQIDISNEGSPIKITRV